MFWSLEFLLFLIGFSVSAFVMRFFSILPERIQGPGDLFAMRMDDLSVSLKMGAYPAAFAMIVTNL